MEYIDFELRISGSAATGYPVEVTRAPAGEDAKGTLALPYNEQALNYTLLGLKLAVQSSGSTRRSGGPDQDAISPADFGHALFSALTQSADVGAAFARSKDVARGRGKGLRIRLRIDSPELASLPWEFLKDPNERDFMALSQWSPVMRYLRTDDVNVSVPVTGAVRVLAMISSPSDEPRLDVEAEKERIERATEDLQKRGLLSIHWMTGSTWLDLQDAFMADEYHVFHYIGHGGFDKKRGEGVLVFTDERGQSAPMGSTEIGRLLADERTLRLVVLNSCLGAVGDRTNLFSSTSGTLVAMGIPAVIAMQYEISDDAAKRFSQVLYKAIATGLPVDAAMSEARKAVSVHKRDSIEWATPVLHTRAPNGVLFEVSPRVAELQETTPSVEVLAVSPLGALGSSSAPPSSQAANFAAMPPIAPTPIAPNPDAPKPKPALDTKEFEKRVRDVLKERTPTPPAGPEKTRVNIDANINTAAVGKWAKRAAIGVGAVCTLFVAAVLISGSDQGAGSAGVATATDSSAGTLASDVLFEDGFTDNSWLLPEAKNESCELVHQSPGYDLTAFGDSECQAVFPTELSGHYRVSFVLAASMKDAGGGIRLGWNENSLAYTPIYIEMTDTTVNVGETDITEKLRFLKSGVFTSRKFKPDTNAIDVEVRNDSIAVSLNGVAVFSGVASRPIAGKAALFVLYKDSLRTKNSVHFSQIKAVALP